ncbi:hypothetical protein R3W88_031675 [Solanum pinnatisectum]|uniref:Uncharacterized protein n=1 Tax=Solanum pinnatisectum TaxID=50273 RepID=A0AAV9LMD7_9SOLN|nr:hypothetical protein R3W88_031675 [Solanum pinnatisectum]
MARTRATVIGGKGEIVPEIVVEALARGRSTARARGHAYRATLASGRACGAAPVRARAREVSLSHRVHYATLQLRGPAREWWRVYSGSLPVGSPPVTWEIFQVPSMTASSLGE